MVNKENAIGFDFEALEAELYSGLAKAFTSLQLDFPDERFYAFTLFVTEYFESVSIAANTERGLEDTARKYREDNPEYAKLSLDDAKAYYRPWFGNFAYFSGGNMRLYRTMHNDVNARFGEFVRKCDTLNDYYEIELNVGWEPAERILIPLRQRVLDICERVMKRLDEAKIFELTNRRENVTLQVAHGDREPSSGRVQRLNPEVVYKRYVKEYDEYKAVYKSIYGRFPEWGH